MQRRKSEQVLKCSAIMAEPANGPFHEHLASHFMSRHRSSASTNPDIRIRLHWVGGKPSASPSSLYVSGRSASSPPGDVRGLTSSGNSLSFTFVESFAALHRNIAPRQLKARVCACAVQHADVCMQHSCLSASSKTVVHGFGHACGCAAKRSCMALGTHANVHTYVNFPQDRPSTSDPAGVLSWPFLV